jgi:hypothetical protein
LQFLQEVVDQRRQVACRLRAVAQGWDFHQLWLSMDAWRHWALLKRLRRLAVQQWRTRQKARWAVGCAVHGVLRREHKLGHL